MVKLIGELLRDHADGKIPDAYLLEALETGRLPPEVRKEPRDHGGQPPSGDEMEDTVVIEDSDAPQGGRIRRMARAHEAKNGSMSPNWEEGGEREAEGGDPDVTMRNIQGLDCAFPVARVHPLPPPDPHADTLRHAMPKERALA